MVGTESVNKSRAVKMSLKHDDDDDGDDDWGIIKSNRPERPRGQSREAIAEFSRRGKKHENTAPSWCPSIWVKRDLMAKHLSS